MSASKADENCFFCFILKRNSMEETLQFWFRFSENSIQISPKNDFPVVYRRKWCETNVHKIESQTPYMLFTTLFVLLDCNAPSHWAYTMGLDILEY